MALPGAWVAYTLTVTNRGTANANLSDAVIVLEGDDTAQLQLDAPDLAGGHSGPGPVLYDSGGGAGGRSGKRHP